MTDRLHPYTVEEFERFAERPENAHRRLELVNGEIVEAMPTPLHGLTVIALIKWLLKYLEANPDAGTLLTEVRIKLPQDEDQAHIPNISFVLREQGDFDRKEPLPFIPALCIEIQSPGQSDRYMTDLAQYYLSNGGKLVWLVYPDRKLVEWLTPNERQLLTVEESLSGGDVLPEFSLPVRNVFDF